MNTPNTQAPPVVNEADRKAFETWLISDTGIDPETMSEPSIEWRAFQAGMHHRLVSQAEQARELVELRAENEVWRAFSTHTNWELSFEGWEDGVWQVHQVNGGRSDREWTRIGIGETAFDAIRDTLTKEPRS